MKLVYEAVEDLLARAWEGNPKRHDIEGVKTSIQRFGYTVPVMVDEHTGKIVAGHGRTIATAELEHDPDVDPPKRVKVDKEGRWMIPVVRDVDFEDEAEAEAYLLADNHLTEKGGYDDEKLVHVLRRVREHEKAFIGTGYTDRQVDRIIRKHEREAKKLQNPDIPDAPKKSVSKIGTVWILGDHRLVCDDSVRQGIARAANGTKVQLVCQDPPYGISYKGVKTKRAEIQNDGFDASALEDLLRAAFGNLLQVTEPGSPWYTFGPPGPRGLIFGNALNNIGVLRQRLEWVKDSLVLQGLADFHYRHEDIWYGWTPGAAHRAPYDRKQDSVFEFARPRKSKYHSTEKPIDLIAELIQLSSAKGHTVIDPFCGSGTTLLACEQLERKCAAVELLPVNCDIIVQRWEELTGKKARRE